MLDWQTPLTVLLSVSGAAIFQAFMTWHKSRQEGQRTGRTDALAEWAKIHTDDLERAVRTDAEILDLHQQINELRTQNQECETKNARMEVRLEYLTEWCEDNGMKPRPWVKDGTNLHRPLPPNQEPKS